MTTALARSSTDKSPGSRRKLDIRSQSQVDHDLLHCPIGWLSCAKVCDCWAGQSYSPPDRLPTTRCARSRSALRHIGRPRSGVARAEHVFGDLSAPAAALALLRPVVGNWQWPDRQARRRVSVSALAFRAGRGAVPSSGGGASLQTWGLRPPDVWAERRNRSRISPDFAVLCRKVTPLDCESV